MQKSRQRTGQKTRYAGYTRPTGNQWRTLLTIVLLIGIALGSTPTARGQDNALSAVIGSTPANQEVVGADVRPTIVFDQPMDRRSVEAAFMITPFVEGQLSWNDDQTLVFNPLNPFERGITYTITIDDDAVSASGAPLRAPFEMAFQVRKRAGITQVIPSDGTQNVEARSTITVVFDRPVVPLVNSADQSGLPQPLSFEPAVEGKGEWIGTSVYQFTPDPAFAGGTTYVVTATMNWTDPSGEELGSSEFKWVFSTIPPQIQYITPSMGEERVGLDTPVEITFNQPMDRASVEANFTVVNTDSGGDVAGTFEWEQDDSVMRFKPSSRYEMGTLYQASLQAGAKSKSGDSTISNPTTVLFRSVPYPRVSITTPLNGATIRPGEPVYIQFNAPIDPESVRGRIIIEPEPEDLSINAYAYDAVYITFKQVPGTTYTVTVEPGITDVYGNTINERFEFSFTVGDYDPRLNLLRRDGIAVTSAYRDTTTMLARFVNVSEIRGRLAPIDMSQFLQSMRYGYTDANLIQQMPLNFTRTWTQTPDVAKNELATVPLLLSDTGKLAPGIYYFDITAPEMNDPNRYYGYPIAQVLVVATAGVTTKVSPTEMLVWVTDLKSGLPLPNVQITVYNDSQINMANGTTDELGMFRVEGQFDAYRPHVVVANGGDAFGVTNTRWSDNFNVYSVEGGFEDSDPVKTVMYLYTDQPIYRPDRPVYYRGVIRLQDDVTFALPANQRAEIIIRDSNGQEVKREAITLNEFGAFSGFYNLPPGSPLGQYTMEVVFNGEYQYLQFQVAEFRPPEFTVTATAEAQEVVAGDTIRTTIDGKFLFGGAVSGAPVSWVAYTNTYYFPWRGIGYYEFVADSYFYGSYQRQIASGTGTLDDNGQLIIEIPAELKDEAGEPIYTAQTFTIEATVTDISNQSVSGRTNVTVHPAELYIGIRPSEYVGTENQPLDVNVVSVDWESDPIPNQRVRYSVVEVRWTQNADTFEWERQRIPVTEGEVTTDEKGEAVFTFTPPNAGVFEIEASARDSRERLAKSVTSVWVSGAGYIPWYSPDKRITLITDKKEYVPGDTATILIASPFEGEVTALISVERANIMNTEVVRFSGSTTYELPLEEIHAPNVYVSVTIMRGSGDDPNSPPDFRAGLVSLNVEVQKQLNVTVTPSTPNAEPGTEVFFDVLTTDLQGNPVPAEVGLSLSDVATLSVGAANSVPVFDFFWSNRGLSVYTATMLEKLIDDIIPEDVEEELDKARRDNELAETAGGADNFAQPTQTAGIAAPAAAESSQRGAADGITADAAAQASVDVRTDFVDTPLWMPNLVTDAGGRGSVSVTLPDNLTTWRLDARAVSAETLVGDATIEIVSTKPLLVRPSTPRFFVVGDESELAVVVNNNSGQDLDVDVTLDAEGVTLAAEPTQRITIPAAGRARVIWLATVQDVENVDVTFTATSGEFADASKPAVGLGDERLLPVYRYLAPDFVSTSGALREPGTRTEGILIPSAELAPEGEVVVNLQTSLAAATIDGLTYLQNYQYQCTEQTVSKFLPNVVTFRALQRLGIDDPLLRAQLDANVRAAITRLKRDQKPDGGWGWYPQDQSSPVTTTYALLGLLEARDADLLVEPEMISRAVSFLLSTVTVQNTTAPNYELNRQAFTLYVLARAGSPNVAAQDALFAQREKMQLYARAFLAQAYFLTGNQDAINTLLSDINNAAVVSATGTHWEEGWRDWWNWGSDVRSTAIILKTLVDLSPPDQDLSPLLPNVVRWLMVARKGDVWENTQETAWSVMALTRWMEESGELEANYNFAVTVNETMLGEGVADQSTLTDTQTLRISVEDMLREQVNRLTFQHGEGEGALYYTATLHVDQPVDMIQPTDRGFALTRTYTNAAGDKVTSAQVGETITVSLEIVVAQDSYYVNIDDPIPAGTELIDRSLQTTSQFGSEPGLQPEFYGGYDFRWGWGWWYFSHTELRSEKIVLSTQYLPRGTYRFVYEIQATTPGTYKVIPAHGQQFYFPEVFGRSAGSVFTVTE